MSFYIAIICYLVCLSVAFMLLATGRNLPSSRLTLFGLLHSMLLMAFLASLVLRKEGTAFNYFFLAYICSGVLLSGLFIRSGFPLYIKAYFGLFALTLPLFMFSPSMLVNFLLTMSYSDASGPKFKLTGKYSLESQTIVKDDSKIPKYKLVLKRGMYKQSIERDINFGGRLDSVKVLEVNGTHSMLIRGYHSSKTFVSSESDSMDVEVSLRKQKYGDVEYKL
ncbi:MAG: hypothetical protein KA444_05365 [Bacteroidia bacterium]|nr:hypothetical protein [Bacteroidia bacterium]